MSHVLTINGGSSSIRFAIFAPDRRPVVLLRGKVERIGSNEATLSVSRDGERAATQTKVDAADHEDAVRALLEWVSQQPEAAAVGAVGHRVVHGMTHAVPERITPSLLQELKGIVPFDPEHLPREIALIEAVEQRYPGLPQVACFDTAFHHAMPRVACQIAIPRRFEERGVRRYGFHGLSYTYLIEELQRLGDPAAISGRVILAHLGGGASLAALRNGKSIDTSMAFTPTAGLVMGTRSGDLDPGLMSYLAQVEGLDAAAFQTLVNHESGMLGVSETSSDIRDLLECEARDPRAAEAIELFCYQTKKWVGAYAAALGGLDTLVFAGGIGENSAEVRRRICGGLGFLGIELDEARNRQNAARISQSAGRVAVRVIRTDEESVIANFTFQLLGPTQSGA